MERDLALIRTKRVERERAAGVLRAQSSLEEFKGDPSEKTIESGEEASKGRLVDGSEKQEMDDVVMLDQPIEKQLQGHSINSRPAPKTAGLGRTEPVAQNISQNANDSKGLVVSTDTYSLEKKPPSSVASKAPNNDVSPEQQLETPTTANLRDTDFETMFNDTENTEGHDEMDFEFDFSGNASINREVLDITSLKNASMNNEDLSNFVTTSTEDINTLLPGLESYVNNAGDDFLTTEMAMTSTLPISDPNRNASKYVASASQGFGIAAAQPNFDDPFSFNDFGGSGDYDMSGEGNIDDIGDFDDLFKAE